MLINISNESFENWNFALKKKARELYGQVVDMPLPAIPPDSSYQDIRQFALAFYEQVARKNPVAVLAYQGHPVFLFLLLKIFQHYKIPCITPTFQLTPKILHLGNHSLGFQGFISYYESSQQKENPSPSMSPETVKETVSTPLNPLTLTESQKKILKEMIHFVTDDLHTKIYILHGYAGTGKTTLIKSLIEELTSIDKNCLLLATTGRAASILSQKTGRNAHTIHSNIYTFSGIQEEDEQGKDPWMSDSGQLFLQFQTKVKTIVENQVVIIDEASMISHLPERNDNPAQYGTGALLHDFMAHYEKSKIIMVGDHCQLPPVSSEPFSAALSKTFLEKVFDIQVREGWLREIHRQSQDPGNPILKIASYFRKHIETRSGIKDFVLPPALPPIFSIHYRDDMIRHYTEALKTKDFHKNIFIVHSNKSAFQINMDIKKSLHQSTLLKEGDLLQVIQNSTIADLNNGDFIIIQRIKGRELHNSFRYTHVEVKALDKEGIMDTWLLEDTLYNDMPNITTSHNKRMLIDFDQRMRNLGIPRKSEKYHQAMMKDKYLNAVRAKFGYVITCHKSQGGEWDHVYLYLTDLSNICGRNKCKDGCTPLLPGQKAG